MGNEINPFKEHKVSVVIVLSSLIASVWNALMSTNYRLNLIPSCSLFTEFLLSLLCLLMKLI